jgi:hypothetical protein
MVDVDFIPPKLLHIYYNNRFALQIFTHSQFCTNFKQTHITIRQYTKFMVISNN